MTNDDCHICGTCWWVNCTNDADYELDVVLKRHGQVAYDGAVDLCAGHLDYASRTGHVNVDWIALEQALARQASRVN